MTGGGRADGTGISAPAATAAVAGDVVPENQELISNRHFAGCCYLLLDAGVTLVYDAALLLLSCHKKNSLSL